MSWEPESSPEEEAHAHRVSDGEREKARFLAQQLVRHAVNVGASSIMIPIGKHVVSVRLEGDPDGHGQKYILRGIYNIAARQRTLAMEALRDIQKVQTLGEAQTMAARALDEIAPRSG